MAEQFTVVVATTSLPLATYIQQELADTDLRLVRLTDPAQLLRWLKQIVPQVILLDANYPTREETAALATRLRQKPGLDNIPLVLLTTPFDPLPPGLEDLPAEHRLEEPFDRQAILAAIKAVSGYNIDNPTIDEETEMGEFSPQTPESARAELEPAEDIIELTDLVEEGIPLDQLPPRSPTLEEPEEKDLFSALEEEDLFSTLEDQTGETERETENEVAFDLGADITKALEPETSPTTAAEISAEESAEESIAAAQPPDGAGSEPETPPESEATMGLTAAPAEETPPEAAADDLADVWPEESPADYLRPDEAGIAAEEAGIAAEEAAAPGGKTPAGEEPVPEAGAPMAAAVSAAAESALRRSAAALSKRTHDGTPEVITDSDTFAAEIDAMSREWSKKIMAGSYRSMERLVTAIGDLAPMIVEQVAKEIIPPLAERIIKAEIERLEKEIEDETP
jgi:CheY-like chemotaxis protein